MSLVNVYVGLLGALSLISHLFPKSWYFSDVTVDLLLIVH